jgi:hypothetical protein
MIDNQRALRTLKVCDTRLILNCRKQLVFDIEKVKSNFLFALSFSVHFSDFSSPVDCALARLC